MADTSRHASADPNSEDMHPASGEGVLRTPEIPPSRLEERLSAILPDPERLETLQKIALMDTPAEEAFDRFTRLASHILDVPVALISFFDDKRLYFKSHMGLPEPYASTRECCLSRTFCEYTTALGHPLVIDDASEHPLVCENPATEEFGIRGYMGVPLITSEGHGLGNFCAIDTEPRQWSEDQLQALEDLAASVMTEIQLRALTRSQETDREIDPNNRPVGDFSVGTDHGNGRSARETLTDDGSGRMASQNGDEDSGHPELQFRRLLDKLPAAAYMCDREGLITYYNQRAAEVWGRQPELHDPIDRFCGSCQLLQLDGTPIDHEACWMAQALNNEREYQEEIVIERPDGSCVKALAHAMPFHDASGNLVGAINVVTDITERTQAEQKLRESKNKLASKVADMERLHALSTRLLQQESVEAALHEVMEASAGLLDADKASTQIYDQEEDVLRLVSTIDFDQAFDEQFQVVNTGSITTCAAALKQREQVLVEDLSADPDYTEFYRIVTRYNARAAFSTPLYDSSGQLLGMFTMYWDEPHRPSEHQLKLLDLYTQQAARQVERERSSEALRESEERFRAFVTASSDVVYRMSSDWTEMRYLEGRDFIADTREPSRTWMDKYIHPDEQQRVMEAINEAIRNKSIFELEHRVLRADGTLGWTSSRAVPILDADDEIIEWFGTATDITERKEAEAELARVTAEIERQKRFYETIISSTPDLVYALDLNYRFTFVNDALLEMWGRTLEESIGKTLREVGYEPWHAEMHERELDEVIATKQPVRGEVAFPHATLGERIYDYIFVPVLDDEGEVEAVVGTTRDITERKKAEEALKEAKEEAEKTARLRSNMLANVSHEIRTPITGILGLAESLEEKVAEPRREEVRLIEKSGRRLMDTFDSVLALAQLEGGEVEVDARCINVTEEIEEIAGSFRPLADEKDLLLEVTSSAPAAKSHLDPALLGRILDNLIINAIKFTDDGRVTVEVSATDENVSIAVSDTGVGISEEFRERLFDEFTQESTGFSRSHEGIGLGLALTKKMTEQLGGRIRVESEKGKGSCFTVVFPRASVESENDQNEREGESVDEAPDDMGMPATSVLLIEDNEIIRRVIVERLGERHGYEVEAFAEAEPALERAEERAFDVVLIDISLPGIDGMKALQRLRSTDTYRERPIIAVTGHALPGDRERFLAEGFSEHMGKPFSADELAEKIQSLDT